MMPTRQPHVRLTRSRRLALSLLVGSTVVVVAVGAALAQGDILGGKIRGADDVTIPASETVDHDLYAAGGTITVDGTIQGDLVASGGQVTVNGTVTGDILVASGTIVIGGTVEGDLRVAGGQVSIGGTVGEDALLLGGQVDVFSGGQIGGDLILAAGQATMSGQVAGSIYGSAGAYQRSGSVGGTENVTVNETTAPPPPTAAEVVADAIRHFLVVLLVGALALWLWPHALAATESVVRREPVRAFMWGIAGLVGSILLIVAIVVLMILVAIVFGILEFDAVIAFAVVGGLLAIGVVCVVFIFIVAYVVDAVVGLALGRVVLRDHAAAVGSRSTWLRDLGLLALGAAVVVVVTSVPVVGGLLRLLVLLLGLGALLAVAWNARRKATLPPPVVPAA